MPPHVDFLILGAGWTSQFLLPLLSSNKITHAATTTTGRDNTIPFVFDPSSSDPEPYTHLPSATTVLITFPLRGHGQSRLLTGLYRSVHEEENNWIQLGSTGIFDVPENTSWVDEGSPYNTTDARAIAEDELRSPDCVEGVVLNLCGLYGGQRVPATWLPRLGKSKADIKARKNVHFIHGSDVARGIVALHRCFMKGKRWIVTDLRSYDWWDLIMSFACLEKDGEGVEEKRTRLRFAEWVGELLVEEAVRGLPRDGGTLGRRLDGRAFWKMVGVWPESPRLA